MGKDPTNEWESGRKSGHVWIGTHYLNLYVSGPDREPQEPVANIIQGLAASIKAFAAVTRLISPFIRTYVYDRSGYGQSDISPKKPSSMVIAAELDLLLKQANVSPPYLLIAHSWGGIIAREFIALRPLDIAGLVLADANQEHMLQVIDWRALPIRAIKGNLDYLEVAGVRKNHKLTEEEWQKYLEDESSAKHRKQTFAELGEYSPSFEILAAKKQLNRTPPLLGDKAVCVIMGRTKTDYEKLYTAGVKAGNGSEEERAAFLEMLMTWEEKDSRLQLEQLSLSSNSRWVAAKECGHNVHLTQPDIVADATRWVLGECLRRGQKSLKAEIGSRENGEKSSAAVGEPKTKHPSRGRL